MDPARVLVVCTGNVCRSPFAERVLTARLGEVSIGPQEIVVTSAGTHARVGDPMTAPMASLVACNDAAHEQFAARLLHPQMVREADLVIAMTRTHRGFVARLHPRAIRYAFTLRELVRLVDCAAPTLRLPDGPPSARLRELVPQLAAQRGMAPVADPFEDDVTDPYGLSRLEYETSVEQMLPGIEALVWALAEGGR